MLHTGKIAKVSGFRMIYVISDLHGYPVEKLKKLLDKAGFTEDDFLYILGDVIDRNNDGGVKTLEWLMLQYNAQLILGNHEAMLLSCEFLFDVITDESIAAFDSRKMQLMTLYQSNGGDVTLKALHRINKSSPGSVSYILDYIRDAPLYEYVTAGGKDFLLCHSGIGGFEKERDIGEYPADAFIWTRPEITDEYFDDIITVFGHTPTVFYGAEHYGKIIKTKTWIDIDVGAADGKTQPVLLRLDDMAEFRLE